MFPAQSPPPVERPRHGCRTRKLHRANGQTFDSTERKRANVCSSDIVDPWLVNLEDKRSEVNRTLALSKRVQDWKSVLLHKRLLQLVSLTTYHRPKDLN